MTGVSCTPALNPVKNGSTIAGISDASLTSTTRSAVRTPFSGKKYDGLTFAELLRAVASFGFRQSILVDGKEVVHP
jgi:hypothetical protein